MITKDVFGNIYKKRYNNLRIPYQGGKQKIAEELMYKMLEIKPNAKYFFDIFAGGGSMSLLALQMGLKVVYNDKQTNLVNFIKYIFNRIENKQKSRFGLFPEEFYNFVNKEEFDNQKTQNTIFSQFCRICYSFGNCQTNYAFGKDIIKQKELAHNIVMFQCEKSLKEFNCLFNVKFKISNKQTWNERRLDYKNDWNYHIKENELLKKMIAEGFIKNEKELTSFKKKQYNEMNDNDYNIIKSLEHLQHLQYLENLNRIQRLKQIQHLERIQHLENLNRIQQLEMPAIQFFNLDYKDVIIDTPHDETIVYLDPPYRNTCDYIEKACNNEIDEYFINSNYSCFMSEYNAPFQSILQINKQKMFSNVNIDKRQYVIENLYYNKK